MTASAVSRAAQPGPHRLLVLLATRSTNTAAWADLARDSSEEAETPADGALLWPLPRLAAIKPEHVERWFTDMMVNKDPLRRRQLSLQLLTSEGEPDSVPQSVLERLRRLLEDGAIPFEENPK